MEESFFGKTKEDVPNKVSKTINTHKIIFTIMFIKRDFLLVDLLPQRQHFDNDYFIEKVMNPTIQRFQKITGRKTVKFHLNNCRVHNSSVKKYGTNRIV